MLGGNVAEGEEEGGGGAAVPGAAHPVHPAPKGKASKPMGVDEVRCRAGACHILPSLSCLCPLRHHTRSSTLHLPPSRTRQFLEKGVGGAQLPRKRWVCLELMLVG